MDILMALNFNVKQIGEEHMMYLLGLKLFDKLKQIMTIFTKENNAEAIEICCHIFSNIFLSKKAVQMA